MLISWETVLFTIALIAGLPIREDERSKHHGDSPDRVLPFRRMRQYVAELERLSARRSFDVARGR
jgi:hypothetical protein